MVQFLVALGAMHLASMVSSPDQSGSYLTEDPARFFPPETEMLMAVLAPGGDYCSP